METEYAWAAGIIDGEGSILISKGAGTRRTTPSYQLYVQVSMTHKETVLKLHKMFGGSFNFHPAKVGRNHKPTFRWLVCDDKAAASLSKLLKHLVTKKDQAATGIAFRAVCKQPLGSRSISKELLNRRERFYKRMKTLNKRGIK